LATDEAHGQLTRVTGIVIPWDPVALRLGTLVLTWHGIFSYLGIVLGIWFAAWLAMLVSVVGIWLTSRTRAARVPSPRTGRDGA